MAGTNTSFRPGSQGDLGNALRQLGAGAYSLVRPFFQPTPYGSNPWNAPASQGQQHGPAYGNVSVPPGGLRNYGTNYKQDELKAGAAAERFRPGAGFPGQQSGSSSSSSSSSCSSSSICSSS